MFIYVLIDPVTNQIRYVGKANDVKARYKSHNNKCRDANTHKRNWINKLRTQGLKPEVEIIDEVNTDNWKYWEKFWIAYYRFIGCDLINHTSGGDGLTFGNQTSFKKGHSVWLGKNHSEETKTKIGNNNLFKGKPAKNRKQIDLKNNFIKNFDSIQQAALETNSMSGKIIACCKHKRKTHNNFKWKYK